MGQICWSNSDVSSREDKEFRAECKKNALNVFDTPAKVGRYIYFSQQTDEDSYLQVKDIKVSSSPGEQ